MADLGQRQRNRFQRILRPVFWVTDKHRQLLLLATPFSCLNVLITYLICSDVSIKSIRVWIAWIVDETWMYQDDQKAMFWLLQTRWVTDWRHLFWGLCRRQAANHWLPAKCSPPACNPNLHVDMISANNLLAYLSINGLWNTDDSSISDRDEITLWSWNDDFDTFPGIETTDSPQFMDFYDWWHEWLITSSDSEQLTPITHQLHGMQLFSNQTIKQNQSKSLPPYCINFCQLCPLIWWRVTMMYPPFPHLVINCLIAINNDCH